MQGSPQLCIRVVHIPTPQAPTKIVQMLILGDSMSEMKEIEVVKLAERKNLTYFFQNFFGGLWDYI
jgi:hypothetical protein